MYFSPVLYSFFSAFSNEKNKLFPSLTLVAEAFPLKTVTKVIEEGSEEGNLEV